MKKMRHLTILMAAFLLVLSACSSTADDPGDGATTTAGASGDDGIRVAIVAPSASNDLAFTQSIVDAVNKLDGVSEIAVTDGTFVVEDAAAAIRDYADQGYDLVLAHGSQYGGSLQEIAPDFPDTVFAWGTAADTFGQDNVYAYEAASDQGGFVMGVIAAALTQSNNIGIVGPVEVGDAKLYVDGFAAGVAAANPATTVNINYIGSFSDVALASEAAESLISAGADVLTGTAQMTVGAIGVANENGVAWFGTQSSQTSVAPDIVVANQVYHWEVVLQSLVDAVRSGDIAPEVLEINLANGGLEIEFNDGYSGIADIRAAAEETIQGLISGALSTGQ
jgi:basic membrane protein A